MQGSESHKASASNSVRCRYDVFLSFRGEDTGKSFTDHLYTALDRSGYHTFREDVGIRKGENAGFEIEKAIQESVISIVVLSKNYASSRWCLNELVQIMERRRTDGHRVIPIFYHIDPSQVRHQSGDYGMALARHESEFNEEIEKVKMWMTALTEVADSSGMVLQNRSESAFIEDFLKEIRKKLDKKDLYEPPCLIGRKNLVDSINGWLQTGMDEVSISTIFGVGGAGKTTLAKIVFNSNSYRFDGGCFLANVGEVSQEANGLARLQMQLVSDVLKEKNIYIWNIDEGMMKIKHALRGKRVLLVLDDMVDFNQFEALVGTLKWFYPGSKIIITTRNKNIATALDNCEKFEVKGLLENESLQLLSWHAIGQDHPLEGYMECLKRVVQKCAGLPLALKVIGASLRGKPRSVWENEIEKLETIMNKGVKSILTRSYDRLADDHDKSLFLDIACFFVGMDRDYVTTILKGCGCYVAVGIQNLIDQCLVSIGGFNKIEMHQLLRDMGKEIVRRESPENPGKRSRVWNDRDALNVLREESGTETIKGLSLNVFSAKGVQGRENANKARGCLSNSEDFFGSKRRRLSFSLWEIVQSGKELFSTKSNKEDLTTNGFKAMHKLQLLRLNHVELSGGFVNFPKNLIWLCWHGFAYKSIPKDLYLGSLVVLEMPYSRLKHNCKNRMVLDKLKTLDLSHCYDLITAPDLTGLPNLERLVLEHCTNLVEIDDSIAYIRKLLYLNLRGCKNLHKLSSKIWTLESLEELDLSDCLQIEDLSLDSVRADSLRILRLRGCKNLHKLSSKIWMLESLEELDLSDCSQIEDLSLDSVRMDSLRILRLDGIPLDRQECSGKNLVLSRRQSRYMIFLSKLRRNKVSKPISFSLVSMASLHDLSLERCNLGDDALPSNLSRISSLTYLDLSKNPFCKLSDGISTLQNLKVLILCYCINLQSTPKLPTGLGSLVAFGCPKLEIFKTTQSLGADFQCQQLHISRLRGKSEELNPLPESSPMANNGAEIKKGPLQVVLEFGTCNFFLPGSGGDIPLWYGYQTEGSMISFKVPPNRINHNIYGLNICLHFRRDRCRPSHPKFLFRNVTKGKQWILAPSTAVFPFPLVLGHWKMDSGVLEAGNCVEVCRIPREDGFEDNVEEFGVGIVYKKRDVDVNKPPENAFHDVSGMPLLPEKEVWVSNSIREDGYCRPVTVFRKYRFD